MSGKKLERTINGQWLERAFEALGVTPYEAAKQQGILPDKYYKHFANTGHLSSESLAALARLYPRLNIRYVLTGEGSPLL